MRKRCSFFRRYRSYLLLCLLCCACLSPAHAQVPPEDRSAKYLSAVTALAAGDYDQAIDCFELLGDYAQSAVYAQEARYLKAEALRLDGDHDAAREQFLLLGDYHGSADKARQCEADRLFSAGEYAAAYELYSTLAPSLQTNRAGFLALYMQAEECLLRGEYLQAAAGFAALGSYRDSAARADNARADAASTPTSVLTSTPTATVSPSPTAAPTPASPPISTVDPNAQRDARLAAFDAAHPLGSQVIFGRYEQDGNPGNGPEPVAWLVLDRRDGAALLLCVDALDAVSYQAQGGDATWADCSLRAWMNDTLFSALFAPEEQQSVCLTHLHNGGAFLQGTPDTEDRLFLLSEDELTQYFASVTGRRAKAAPAAASSSAWTNARGLCYYWLRSSTVNGRAAYVSTSGEINHYYAEDARRCVRPALWVDLTAADLF